MIKETTELIKERKNSEMSSGERTVFKYLSKGHFKFEREYFFEDCLNKNTGHYLFFDFFLFDYNTAIEVDGKHHYEAIKGESALQYQKVKDNIKNKYCKQNGIRLIRLRYEHGNISVAKLERLLTEPIKNKRKIERPKKVRVKVKFINGKTKRRPKDMSRLIRNQAQQQELIDKKREQARSNYPPDILERIKGK